MIGQDLLRRCDHSSRNSTQDWAPKTSPNQTRGHFIDADGGRSEAMAVLHVEPARTMDDSLPLHAERPPLRVDEGGAVRVGKSRISLDLVVEQYESGVTPEDMVRAYDTLVLADVHAVIAYYLRHKDEVRAYLKRRAEEAEALRAKIEAERPRVTREELLARRSAREKDHAPTGQ